MNCPSCKAANDESADTCFTCGRSLTAVIKKGSVLASRYEILNPLGKGGMGMVYKAHDQVLDETIAIKVLRSDVARSPDMARRFRSEIRLARKVTHKNVCRIHEYGEDQGSRYISMELIEGVDLKQVVREKQGLPVSEAFEVGIQLGKGLQAIHDVGIIHRDLKSANIMRDPKGTVKLMDFGIAKQEGSGAGATATGDIVGTPEYMSPEQARGLKVDFRSDIYALGIVLFEIFTGDVPFRGDTPIVTIFKHIQEAPPLDNQPKLPEAVIPVLRRALAKDPADRFNSSREVADALRQARAATFPEVTPTPLPTPVRPSEPEADYRPSPTHVPGAVYTPIPASGRALSEAAFTPVPSSPPTPVPTPVPTRAPLRIPGGLPAAVTPIPAAPPAFSPPAAKSSEVVEADLAETIGSATIESPYREEPATDQTYSDEEAEPPPTLPFRESPMRPPGETYRPTPLPAPQPVMARAVTWTTPRPAPLPSPPPPPPPREPEPEARESFDTELPTVVQAPPVKVLEPSRPVTLRPTSAAAPRAAPPQRKMAAGLLVLPLLAAAVGVFLVGRAREWMKPATSSEPSPTMAASGTPGGGSTPAPAAAGAPPTKPHIIEDVVSVKTPPSAAAPPEAPAPVAPKPGPSQAAPTPAAPPSALPTPDPRPAQVANLIREGDNALAAQKYDAAAGFYDEALKRDPQSAKARQGKSNAVASAAASVPKPPVVTPLPPKPVEVAPPPTRAPEPSPVDQARRQLTTQIALLMNQGGAALGAQRYDDAIKAYDEVLKLEPQNADAIKGKANAVAGAAAARRAFVSGKTVVAVSGGKKGPAGFDTSEVEVTTPDFVCELSLHMGDFKARPGESYSVKVDLANKGKKTIKIKEMIATTTVNGKPTGKPINPLVREIDNNKAASIAQVQDAWPEGANSWSLKVKVGADRGECSNELTWK